MIFSPEPSAPSELAGKGVEGIKSSGVISLHLSDPGKRSPCFSHANDRIWQSGITGMITIVPAVYLYRKDRDRRVFGRLVSNPPGEKLNLGECGLLLLFGAGLAFYVNLFVGILQIFVQDNTYQNMMESITTGYSLWEMILWMGIVAPLAEETIFRWLMYLRLRDYMRIPAAAILSGVIFGVFHGNFVQIIYAGILGAVMAYILEMSGNLWSSVLLHIGANVFSLLLTEAAPKLLALEGTPYAAMANTAVLTLYGILLAAVIFGIFHFVKKGKKRGYRAI